MTRLISITLIILTLSACTVDMPPHINTMPAALAAPVPALVMTVCGSYGLNVREGAGIEHPVIGGLQDGDVVEVFGYMPDNFGQSWAEIEQGYVSARYLCEKGKQE